MHILLLKNIDNFEIIDAKDANFWLGMQFPLKALFRGSKSPLSEYCVPDVEDPTITCQGNITLETTPGQPTAVGVYNPKASDNSGQYLNVSCSSAKSGSRFAIGRTEVKCQVRDTAGNTAMCLFVVQVKGKNNVINISFRVRSQTGGLEISNLLWRLKMYSDILIIQVALEFVGFTYILYHQRRVGPKIIIEKKSSKRTSKTRFFFTPGSPVVINN